MTVALLDINDCVLQLWGSGPVQQSPGYALLEGKAYQFGSTARGSARLRPRDINNRYWWQLSIEPLQPALGPARHTADLVHEHLLQLHRESGQPKELLLACSGSMQREQLSLLLGIVQQCPFEVVGLVNRSALLGSLHGGPGRLFHLELQLHQALLAELVQNGEEITVQRSVPLPGCGLLQLQERLVEVVANAFIRQTRFDPRRKAQTEQQLYDALPKALQALADSPETNIEINGYRARIASTDMVSAGQRLFTAAAEAMGSLSPADRLIADPLVALLPGVRDKFPHAEFALTDELWQAMQQLSDHLLNRDGPLSFVTSLPCLAVSDNGPIEPAALEPMPVAITQPTHVLVGSTARPLTETIELASDIKLVKGDRGWLLTGSATVNGTEAKPDEPLAAGDVVATPDGVAYQLIEVVD